MPGPDGQFGHNRPFFELFMVKWGANTCHSNNRAGQFFRHRDRRLWLHWQFDDDHHRSRCADDFPFCHAGCLPKCLSKYHSDFDRDAAFFVFISNPTGWGGAFEPNGRCAVVAARFFCLPAGASWEQRTNCGLHGERCGLPLKFFFKKNGLSENGWRVFRTMK